MSLQTTDKAQSGFNY